MKNLKWLFLSFTLIFVLPACGGAGTGFVKGSAPTPTEVDTASVTNPEGSPSPSLPPPVTTPADPTVVPAGDSGTSGGIKISRAHPAIDPSVFGIKKKPIEVSLGKNVDTLASHAQVCGSTGDVYGDGEAVTDHCFNDPSVGGILATMSCDSGTMVNGLRAELDDDNKVMGLQFRCEATNKQGDLSPAGNTTRVGRNSGVASTSDSLRHCPEGEVAVGIYGKAGDSLNSLGLICAPWNLEEKKGHISFSSQEKRQAAGNTGGSLSYEIKCPENFVMTGAMFWVNEGQTVGPQSLECAKVTLRWNIFDEVDY